MGSLREREKNERPSLSPFGSIVDSTRKALAQDCLDSLIQLVELRQHLVLTRVKFVDQSALVRQRSYHLATLPSGVGLSLPKCLDWHRPSGESPMTLAPAARVMPSGQSFPDSRVA